MHPPLLLAAPPYSSAWHSSKYSQVNVDNKTLKTLVHMMTFFIVYYEWQLFL